MQALLGRRLSLSGGRGGRRRLRAMPMRAHTAPGRLITGASRIRSMSRRTLQRRGIGRLLLGRSIAESEARGFRQMIAVIGDSAQAASIALHAAAGFTMIGTLRSVGFKLGRWLDTRADAARASAVETRRRLTSPTQNAPYQAERALSRPPRERAGSSARARGRARGRGARSGRLPKSRCRRPVGAPSLGFFSIR